MGSTVDDVGKEVAIFAADKATPIVVADDGDADSPGVATIDVPPIDLARSSGCRRWLGICSADEAALAIDASATRLREAREGHRAGGGADVTATPAAGAAAEIGRPPTSTSTGCGMLADVRPPRGEHGGTAWPVCS